MWLTLFGYKIMKWWFYATDSKKKKKYLPTYPNSLDRVGSGETEIFLIMAWRKYWRTVKTMVLANFNCLSHYANMSVQCTAIFHVCKNGNFRWKKKVIFLLFLLKTKIVGTRLNRLSEVVLTSTHNLCFKAKIRK